MEISSGKSSTVVGEVYRIPNTNEATAIERYENILIRLRPQSHNIILGTDQNFDYIKVNDHRPTSLLLNTFVSNGLVPCINRPTRVTHLSATLIDNIYLNANLYKNCCSGILISDLSDHFPIIVCVGNKSSSESTEPKHITFSYRDLNDTAYTQLRQLLNQVNWNFTHSVDLTKPISLS